MDYLIRFVQQHESFRRAEIEALANLANINVEWISYLQDSPFAVVRLCSESDARTLLSRSILSRGIYELWGSGTDYETLHASVSSTSSHLWPLYTSCSFRFDFDTYCGTRSNALRRGIINSFRYLNFQGPIKMSNPDETFCIFEEYDDPTLPLPNSSRSPHTTQEPLSTTSPSPPQPDRLFLGRFLASSSRVLIDTHDLKKRTYISTTSMDAELSLITANLALAAPSKIFYDPFVGTGSFLVAAAQFGAHVMGSDIDGRSFKGNHLQHKQQKGKPLAGGPVAPRSTIGVLRNLQQYGLADRWLDCFIGDLTNSPISLRTDGHHPRGWLNGIICDPPYGVREGLKVLGARDGRRKELVLLDGVPAHTLDGYIAPKKPYSFVKMLDDILEFAAGALVEGGRLAMWMPTANEEQGGAEEGEDEKGIHPERELEIPRHERLELVAECVQPFNKWSRRLLTYQRLVDSDGDARQRNGEKEAQTTRKEDTSVANGTSADDLNPFRRKYFQSFKKAEEGMGLEGGKHRSASREEGQESQGKETDRPPR